ncbi:MAG TPA: hypothetical protein VF345_02220 [Chthoniobacterales bacterium]
MKTIHLRKQSGSSLVVVISVLATLMVIVGVAAEYTWVVNRHVQRSNTLENAVAVGDSCIDMLFANWRDISRQSPTTAKATSAFASIPLPTSAQLNLPAVSNFAKRGTIIDPKADEGPSPAPSDYDANYTISNYKVIAVSPEWTALSAASAAPTPELGPARTGNINTTSANFDYIASADVTLPALGPSPGKVVAKVRRVFQKQQISPWNFAIFYVDPLEIHPGPQFTVTGWVHTNSDLYTGHDTLTFADKVTYGSDWFAPTTVNPNAGFKPGDGQHPETPTAPHYPSNLPPAHDDAKQPFGLDSTQLFSTTDPNTNNDSYRELIELPSASFPDPLATARYWDQAAVVIRINADNTYSIGTPHVNGSGVYDGTINVLNSGSLYNMFNGAISTGGVAGSIQDNREGASIRLATLDISQILPIGGPIRYKDPGFTNPIIYIYDASATSHPLNPDGTVNLSVNKRSDGTTSATPVTRGIRIKNGSKIPAAGLTIASNNPVYIQGDFNTGGNPPSNSGNPADAVTPQVAGYTRAPCSILADAINILSNSYVDGTAGAAPTASNTTINAAIVSGIVPTAPVGGDGSYSGGAENFPRFLEDWSSNSLTYYGSMVELYKSQQSTGEWTCCNPVYSPPTRQWYFDNNFKINPPPGTLMVYSYVKGKWSLY